MDKLEEVENNKLFNRGIKSHDVFRRDADEDTEDEEGRGWWKNGKNKNKEKKNRNKKKRKEIEYEEDNYSEEEEAAPAPYTNGLQFSAYGSNQRPVYSPPASPRPTPAATAATSPPAALKVKQYMYGLDQQGNPQFIDQATVCMLLKKSKRASQVNCQVQ